VVLTAMGSTITANSAPPITARLSAAERQGLAPA
jgi:hypothetical protein